MNCANHPELPASAFCRECGKPMCQECQRPAMGSIYCAEHVPVAAAPPPPPPPSRPYVPQPSPYTAPAPSAQPHEDLGAHPALALILGFIPGVGAIYNGQYAKGLIHVVVFGLLVSLASSNAAGGLEPLIGLLIAAWVFYMAFEAFHTARSRRYGAQVGEFSSLFDVRPTHGRFPAGALLLIVLGFLLLLDTTDIINLEQLERYWPIGLIAVGAYMLYARFSASDRHADSTRDAEVRR
ncbi:MAG TPA: B-box zinc finger protein [Bryobacteraceae bacterium]|nr:B-box zinc finger protein [Bryobacteraceae bacterium]